MNFHSELLIANRRGNLFIEIVDEFFSLNYNGKGGFEIFIY